MPSLSSRVWTLWLTGYLQQCILLQLMDWIHLPQPWSMTQFIQAQHHHHLRSPSIMSKQQTIISLLSQVKPLLRLITSIHLTPTWRPSQYLVLMESCSASHNFSTMRAARTKHVLTRTISGTCNLASHKRTTHTWYQTNSFGKEICPQIAERNPETWSNKTGGNHREFSSRIQQRHRCLFSKWTYDLQKPYGQFLRQDGWLSLSPRPIKVESSRSKKGSNSGRLG